MAEKLKPVRVRLAPSPTGTPHIGTMRQAVFDWLLARSTGGKFILRIEDTDRNRFVPGSLEEIYESLRWLGLDWDEGPEVGGPYAPYVQSERLPLYQGAAQRLVASGQAYECYCTPERLDEMRNRQRELKLPPGYDGLCSTPEGREKSKALSSGRPPVVRFHMPDEGSTIVPDFLRGQVTFENVRLDDAVILKSDGYPTYHLAVVVDDHEMEITHVIRGEEWLPSAPLHQRIYRALGYEMPVFIHTPLILGTDRSKLSKRHGAQSALEYRDAGYLPEAVFNFLALLGWSLDDKTEIISREQFVEHFDIDRLLKSPAVFNKEKLDWMNAQYMQQMPVPELAKLIAEWLEKPEDDGGLPDTVKRPLDLEYTGHIVPLIRERVKLLPEARDMMTFYYLPGGVDPDVDMLLGKAFREDRSRAQLLCSEALVTAEGISTWTNEALNEAYSQLAERLEASRRDLFGLIRVAVTGRTVAPPLFETMEILGKERCVLRLREALGVL
jgi:glutamyl-tRNA synthetase